MLILSIFRFQTKWSKMIRVTKTAVNTLTTMPIVNVTAKPLTGPVPKPKRKSAATSVVTLESKMVKKAFA